MVKEINCSEHWLFLSVNIPFSFWYQENYFPLGNQLPLAYCSLVSICCQSRGPTSLPLGTMWPRLANESFFLGINNDTERERIFLLLRSPVTRTICTWGSCRPSSAPCGQSQARVSPLGDHVFAKMSPIPHSFLWHASCEAMESIFPPLETGLCDFWARTYMSNQIHLVLLGCLFMDQPTCYEEAQAATRRGHMWVCWTTAPAECQANH